MSYLNEQTGYYELPAGTAFYIDSAYFTNHYCLGKLVVDTHIKASLINGDSITTDCSGLLKVATSSNISWTRLSYVYRFLELTDYGACFRPDAPEDLKQHYFLANGERAFYLHDSEWSFQALKGQGVLW